MRFSSQLVTLVFLLLAARPTVIAQHAAPGPTRAVDAGTKPVTVPPEFQAQVEAVAQAITHVATRAIILNRPLPWYIPSNLLAEQTRLLTDLRAMGRQPEALRLLLKNPDPRVRTVALGALFAREDPRDLPFIAALINDAAPTVPDLHETMSPMVSAALVLQPLDQAESPLTVGRIARSMIHFYFEAAHIPFNGNFVGQPYYPQSSTEELLAAFNRYWAERKDRASCASWYLVKLERATRSTNPVQPQYQADIDAVFAQIKALPSPRGIGPSSTR